MSQENHIKDICGITIPGLFEKPGKRGFEYTIGSNGVFRKVNNGVFSGYVKVEGIPSLPEIKPEVCLTLKKIPSEILFKILRFMSMYEDEVYCQVYLNKKNGEYFVYVPEQVVGSASVDYKCNREMEKNHRLVAEFHSHPFAQRATYFSGIDDADEKAGIIYGVVSGSWEVKLRIKYAAQEMELTVEDVFELTDIPKEWHKKVKVKQEKLLKGVGYHQPLLDVGGVRGYRNGYPTGAND